MKPPVFRRRPPLLGEAFRQIGANRFRCAPHLVGQGVLFDLRERQADPMKVERYPIRPLEDLEVFEGLDRFARRSSWYLVPDI